jgi:xylulokinase
MLDDTLLLGIDAGTTNCKAFVFDTTGRPHGAASAPTPARRPRSGWIEYDPETLWETVVALVRQALGQVDPARVRGVAVASMAEAGLLLDAAGRPLSPIISWQDSRSDPQYRWWLDHIGAETFFPIAQNRPNPVFGVFKLMWLRDQAPDAYAAAARWLHVADYIAFRLCGAQATDCSLATRTMLFDLRRRGWSDDLIAAAGVRADLLPQVVPSGTRLGTLTPAAATALGLPAAVVVGSGGHDHVCGAFAAGAHAPGVALDSMGTAEPAFMPIDRLPLDQPSAAIECSLGAHVARGRYYAIKGIRNSGAAVAWASRMLGFDDWPDHAHIQAAAAQAPAGSGGVFFLPRLAPIDRGAFVGLTAEATAADMARAVYEGLAYEWRSYLEQIERTAQIRAATIRLIGGGARSDIWVQIKADVLGRPLHVLDMSEGVALGAALLGGLAAGVYPDEAAAIARLRHVERVVTPDPARSAIYDRCYRDVYLQIAPALRALNDTISDLPSPEAGGGPF